MNSAINVPSNFQCPKHKKPIVQLNLTQNHQRDRRLLCQKCDYNNQTNLKYIGDVFDFLSDLQKDQSKATQQIEELNIKFQQKKDEIINQLDQIESQIQQLKAKIESNQVISDQAIKKYLEKKNNYPTDDLIELASILSSNVEITEEQIRLKKDLITQEDKEQQERIRQKINSLGLNNQSRIYKKSNIQSSGVQKVQLIQTQQKQLPVNDEKITFREVSQIDYQSNVFAIQFNRTGQLLAVGGSQIKNQQSYLQILRITEQNQLILEQTLTGHTRDVKSICFSSIDDSFITGSVDTTVRYWKYQKNKQWTNDQILQQHQLAVNCVKLSPTNKFLASACQKIIIWQMNPLDNNEWQSKTEIGEHEKSVLSLSFNEDETYLISGGSDFRILVMAHIKENDWQIMYQIEDLNQQVIYLAFTDLLNFISFQSDQTMRYWTHSQELDVYEFQTTIQEYVFQSVSYCQQKRLLAYSTNFSTQIYELLPNKTMKLVFDIQAKSLSTQFQKDGTRFALMTEGKLRLCLIEIELIY